MQHNIKNFR